MLTLSDVPAMAGRFDVINIKLDKCGGLTEGLEMARLARRLGLRTMVGNMMGVEPGPGAGLHPGSALCVVDLDGPIFLQRASRRAPHMRAAS